MKIKTKKNIVFRFQIIFFSFVFFLTIIYEYIWVVKLFDALNLLSPLLPNSISLPSIPRYIFSLISVGLMLLNWALASFSLYAFIFILRIFESNPEKTLPICAISLDFIILTQFVFQLSTLQQISFLENLPSSFFYIIPNLFNQNSAFFFICAIFSFLLSLKFGIEGLYNRRKIKPNFLSDFIHYLMILNSILVLGGFIFYIFTYNVNSVILYYSIIISLSLFSILLIIMKKKNVKFPINAIAKYHKK